MAILVFTVKRKAALVNQSIKISKNASQFILSTLKRNISCEVVKLIRVLFQSCQTKPELFSLKNCFFELIFPSISAPFKSMFSEVSMHTFCFRSHNQKCLITKTTLILQLLINNKKKFFVKSTSNIWTCIRQEGFFKENNLYA
jgi:hypothetical protein